MCGIGVRVGWRIRVRTEQENFGQTLGIVGAQCEVPWWSSHGKDPCDIIKAWGLGGGIQARSKAHVVGKQSRQARCQWEW